MTVWGYARVDSGEPGEALRRQCAELLQAGVGAEQIFYDAAPAARPATTRPGFQALLQLLERCDTLTVCDGTSLGGSRVDVAATVNDLLTRGVSVHSVADQAHTAIEGGLALLLHGVDSTKKKRSLPRAGALLVGAGLALGGCQGAPTEDEPAWPDVGLAVLDREQTDADVPPAELLGSRGLDGIDPASTRLVGSHGDTRFFVGFGANPTGASDSPLELCFFVETADYNAGPIICGPPESYDSMDGVETWYGGGHRALLVSGIHYEPGPGWARVAPNLYVDESVARAEADR